MPAPMTPFRTTATKSHRRMDRMRPELDGGSPLCLIKSLSIVNRRHKAATFRRRGNVSCIQETYGQQMEYLHVHAARRADTCRGGGDRELGAAVCLRWRFLE